MSRLNTAMTGVTQPKLFRPVNTLSWATTASHLTTAELGGLSRGTIFTAKLCSSFGL